MVDKPLLRYTLANGERRVKVDYHHSARKNSQTRLNTLTKFKINNQKVSLIEAKPLTGRTHQIRVHLASLGHGLLGDDKYLIDDPSGVRRLCLHAWRLQIANYPLIQADLPNDLQSFIGEYQL